MKGQPRINRLIDFIYLYNKEGFKTLQDNYTEYKLLLQPGEVLGPETEPYQGTQSGKAAAVLTKGKTDVIIAVTLTALKTAYQRAKPNKERLRQRLLLSKRIRLVGSIVATISGGGLLATLFSDNTNINLAILAAIINVIASLSSLYAGHLESNLFGGEGNLIDVFSKIIQTTANAEQLFQEMEIAKKTYASEDEIFDIVKRANNVIKELREFEDKLWGSESHKVN